MKILHLNNERTWRGGERQTLLLAARLREREIAGAIACRPGAPLEQEARARQVPTLRMAGGTLRALADAARASRGFDLLHCHTGRTHSLAALAGLFTRKPFLVTRRVDFAPRDSWFNRYKYRAAARVVCISECIAGQLRDLGVPPSRLAVIPSAVPLPEAPPVSGPPAETLRARLHLPPDKKLVGTIGALVGHKDHATLLRAAREVAATRSDVVFVLIGDGELQEPLLQLRAQLGLEQTVLFAGFIPQAETLLPAFDVMAMSSCMEGLGSIVLDAFAARVPVAATAGGGLPELVRDEQTGLLVPVGDAQALAGAILRLLAEPELARRLVAGARACVEEHYSVDRMAARYLEVYRAILAP